MVTDTSNINFQLAADFINYTNRSVFLTGKAGTGKTTFLKYIKEHSVKQLAVVAPTGVAAINAGGVTIHSFFQLPFTPYVPESTHQNGLGKKEVTDKHHLLGRIRMSNDRRKIIQQLELLIIDEISMVRADVLDAIDAVLRHFRNRYYEPFGGVQVLLIGDMYQLPPVVPDEEWKILSQYYNSLYFFDSRVMQVRSPAYIELDKIYRQSDTLFINVLNQVRNNEPDENSFSILHQRYQPGFRPAKEDGYIILTTHNYKADTINAVELGKLSASLFSFRAIIEGDFSEKSYPADEVLHVKVEAQVMFIKNDMDKSKRYFNGKIGTIKKIEDSTIFVQCKNEPTAIEVGKETWKNIRYTINNQTQKVEEEEVGSFTQYPLRLAWAITIHKSQGLTFEKAIIDAGQAFAPGQVYVALSRCTSLQGLILLSRITRSGLYSDERITRFCNNNQPAGLPKELLSDKQRYQSKLLMELFDFTAAVKQCNTLLRDVKEHASSFNKEALPFIHETQTKLDILQQVYKKFEPHLQQLTAQETLPELNAALQERVKKAVIYFEGHLQSLITFLHRSPSITDSKQFALAYNEDLKDLFILLSQQLQLIQSCANGFSVDVYHQSKNNFTAHPFTVNAYAGTSYKKTESPHPLLHQRLRRLRDSICEKGNLPLYLVAGSNTIDEMARYLPQTLNELKKIPGFGDAKIEKFGLQFIDVIESYCKEHNLSSLVHEKIPKREKKEKPAAPKIDTKLESYTLYKEGKSVTGIATTRGLTPQTVEGHLAHFVSLGKIKIEELVSREKIIIIEPALKTFEGGSITPIKEKLGDDISFGEIRLVLAWKEFEEKLMGKKAPSNDEA